MNETTGHMGIMSPSWQRQRRLNSQLSPPLPPPPPPHRRARSLPPTHPPTATTAECGRVGAVRTRGMCEGPLGVVVRPVAAPPTPARRRARWVPREMPPRLRRAGGWGRGVSSCAHARDVQGLLGAVVLLPEAQARWRAAFRGALHVALPCPRPPSIIPCSAPTPHPCPWTHTAKIGSVPHSCLQRHNTQQQVAPVTSPGEAGHHRPCHILVLVPTRVLHVSAFSGFPMQAHGRLKPGMRSRYLVGTLARPRS